MAAVSSLDIGPELIRILGLPAETSFLQLTLRPNAAVEVTCTYFPTEQQLRQVQEVLQRYHLVLVEETPVTDEARTTQAQTLQALDRLTRATEDLSRVVASVRTVPGVREALHGQPAVQMLPYLLKELMAQGLTTAQEARE